MRRSRSGEEVAADVVLIGVGIVPNTELARGGWARRGQRGAHPDEFLRTSDPEHLTAAGDVARYLLPPVLGERIRVRALGQRARRRPGGGVGHAWARMPSTTECPSSLSDQYTSSPMIGMEFSGFVAPGGYDRVVFRGSSRVEAGRRSGVPACLL